MEYLSVSSDRPDTTLASLIPQATLLRLLASAARAGGTSLSLCEADGHLFVESLLEQEDLHHVVTSHRLFVSEVLVKAALQDEGAGRPVRVKVGAGAWMLVAPVVVEDVVVGGVVAGPAWSRRPGREQVEELLQIAGATGKPAARLVASAPVVSSRALPLLSEGVETLAILAGQLGEERRRHERSVRTMTSLNRIGQAVNSTLGLELVLEEVLDQALGFLHAESGSLMLKDASGYEMRILVARGLPEHIVAETRVKVGEGISGQVALEGYPRLLRQGVRESASRMGRRRSSDIQSALCVPLKVRDEIIGVLNVKGRQGGGDFTEQDLDVLSVMASHAAGAIANAQMYENVRRRANEMGALFAVGTAVNSELERNQVLQKVLDHATDLLAARKGSIMLLDAETDELHIEVASGLDDEIISSVRLRLGEGIAGKVAQEGRPRLLHKGVTEEDSASKRREHAAALCIPLIVRDKVIGVLNVSDRLDDGDFSEDDLQLLTMMANQAAIAIENAKLHMDLHELFVSSITALANAIDARDPYTRGHSERVAVYAVRIGERMGLEARDLDYLRYASLLHDVGKINIKDEILNKPGRLTDEEFQVMKKHPEYGAAIMMPVKAFRKIIPFMFYHHERYCSGGGYPQGLQGEAIPQEARIISVADSYDAMTSHRPYRRALTIEQAVSELVKFSGTQFDPRVVEVFLQILEEDPDFARCGIEASLRSEREGWIRRSHEGAFSPRGGPPVSPSPRPLVPSQE